MNEYLTNAQLDNQQLKKLLEALCYTLNAIKKSSIILYDIIWDLNYMFYSEEKSRLQVMYLPRRKDLVCAIDEKRIVQMVLSAIGVSSMMLYQRIEGLRQMTNSLFFSVDKFLLEVKRGELKARDVKGMDRQENRGVWQDVWRTVKIPGVHGDSSLSGVPLDVSSDLLNSLKG